MRVLLGVAAAIVVAAMDGGLGMAAANEPAAQTYGETCTGSETGQVGSQDPKTLPYTLVFSADIGDRTYCYAACGEDESFVISDPDSLPIKLADMDLPEHVRRLTFDPRTSKVTDDQVIKSPLSTVTRRASADCKASAFHQPWPQTEPIH